MQIFIGEISMYMMKSTREALIAQEKMIVTGECCYLNPLIRRIIRFIGKSFLLSSSPLLKNHSEAEKHWSAWGREIQEGMNFPITLPFNPN